MGYSSAANFNIYLRSSRLAHAQMICPFQNIDRVTDYLLPSLIYLCGFGPLKHLIELIIAVCDEIIFYYNVYYYDSTCDLFLP